VGEVEEEGRCGDDDGESWLQVDTRLFLSPVPV